MFAVCAQVPDFGVQAGMCDETLQATLLQLLGPAKKKYEEVDMVASMKEAQLYDLFDVNQWPSSAAVRELATQLKSKRFVCSDLRK